MVVLWRFGVVVLGTTRLLRRSVRAFFEYMDKGTFDAPKGA